MKKSIFITALFLCLALFATGCTNVTKDDKSGVETVELFFSNADGSDLKSEARQIEGSGAYALAKKAVAALIKGPESTDLKRLIPQGTTVAYTNIDAGTFSLDFSSEFGNTVQGMLKVYSIVKTVCGIKGIDRVKITVVGKFLKLPNGADMKEITPDDIKDKLTHNFYVEMKLYFINPKLELSPEYRVVIVKPNASPEEAAINELIKGPTKDSNISIMPKNTRLLGMFIKDGICYANFSNEFYNNREASDTSDRATIYSIAKTLTEFDGVQSVRFFVNGKSLDNYGSVELRLPIGRE